MELLGVFFATIIVFSMLCGTPDGNDNAVFRIHEGQSITIGGGVVEYYDKEKDITFIHDFSSGEIIDEREGK